MPGTNLGGRPHGHVGFFATVKRHAKREGLDVRTMMWKAFKGLVTAAEEGDARAAAIVFDRLCGPVPRDPSTVVNVAQEQTAIAGPPIPQGADLRDYVRNLSRLAEEILGDPIAAVPSEKPTLPEARPQLAPALEAIPPTDPPRAALPEIVVETPWRCPIPPRQRW